jgi:hypothetical protein
VTDAAPSPADLAPGDAKSGSMDWTPFEIHRIRSTRDPLFDIAYQALWDEFGAAHEMEQRDVLERRFAWDAARPTDGYALLYEMILVRLRDKGQLAAVRDHVVIARADPTSPPRAVVFLSHNLVAPEFRRSGLAGWMRAFPVQTARACLAAAALPADAPITLVGEMEPLTPDGPTGVLVRLKAYEKAGFRKVGRIAYEQPDFRSPAAIDATGGPRPLPMNLLVRRVGREHETTITGGEVRDVVELLYHMYARAFRARDMAGSYERLAAYPPRDAEVPLVLPTG